MKGIDLFAGCGGLSLGFQNAGFEILAACDNWQTAIEIYRQNFRHKIYYRNLERWQESITFFRKFEPDFIIGSPPCQDFSSAGKRNENSGNGDLTISFANIFVSFLSQFFVMENVERFNKTEKYKISKAIFENAGYGISEKNIRCEFMWRSSETKKIFLDRDL